MQLHAIAMYVISKSILIFEAQTCHFAVLPFSAQTKSNGQSLWQENTLEVALLELAVGSSRAQKWQVTLRTRPPVFDERFAVLISSIKTGRGTIAGTLVPKPSVGGKIYGHPRDFLWGWGGL